MTVQSLEIEGQIQVEPLEMFAVKEGMLTFGTFGSFGGDLEIFYDV